MNKTKIILLLTFFLSSANLTALTENKYITPEIIKKYAPLVYLHHEEEYKPSSVDYFFNYVHHDLKLNSFYTKQKIDCPSCDNLNFFKGQNLEKDNIPVYAMVVPKPNISPEITDVFYWMFYPYNRGKRVCISPIYINGNCWGKYSTFGHHVGDWEHVTIRFKNNKPYKIYLSQHNGGTSFDWGDYQIQYTNSELAQKDYLHPIVYSAKGSHGLYEKPGDHIYYEIFNGDKLVDKTSNGSKWQTWKNIKIINWKPTGQYSGEVNWMNHTGDWGNNKDGCTFLGFDFEKILGSCILNSGPAGPNMKPYTNPHQHPNDDEFNQKIKHVL